MKITTFLLSLLLSLWWAKNEKIAVQQRDRVSVPKQINLRKL